MNANLHQRYEDYRYQCIHVLDVYPASLAIWQQIEPWLKKKGRIAVLDELRGDRNECGGTMPFLHDELVSA